MKIKLLLSLFALSTATADDNNRSRPGPIRDNMLKAIASAGEAPTFTDVTLLKQLVDDLMKDRAELRQELKQSEARLRKCIEDKQLVEKRLDAEGLTLGNIIKDLKINLKSTSVERDDLQRIVWFPGNVYNGWTFTEEFGWAFITPATYPYMFLSESNTWIYYELGSNPRMIFNFTTNEWLQLDEERTK
jgi:hypothetical protein